MSRKNKSEEMQNFDKHALKIFEERNRAFRVLYDTVWEVEGGTNQEIFTALCRNLRRICDARFAALASFNQQNKSIRLEAIDSVSENFTQKYGNIEIPAPEAIIESFRQKQILSCKNHDLCMVELFRNHIPERYYTPDSCCYRISSIREGQLMAIGMVQMDKDCKLKPKDLIDTFLTLSGMIIQRVNDVKALQSARDELEIRVEERTRELASSNEELRQEIAERKKVEAELERAKLVAEASSRAKSEFLANMSHEIRTPMNGITGMTEVLLSSNLSREQNEMLTVIKTSSETLLNIINDILDLSKVEAGKMVLENRKFNFISAVEMSVGLFQSQALGKDLEIISHIKPGVPGMVIGDETRICQIFINIIGNAVKFTDSGEVVISVEKLTETDNETEIYCKVSDTGIGIPLEKQEQIFHSFTQADSSTTRKFGGTGLGTTISKMLVNLMKGTIRVESPNPATSNPNFPGSVFHFSFKLEKTEPDEPVYYDFDASPIRTLIVDDNPTNCLVLHEMLKLFGFIHIERVGNPAEAIAKLRSAAIKKIPFQLLMTDFNMPLQNGLEFLKQARTENLLPSETKIVLLPSDLRQTENFADFGVHDLVLKPVKQSRLFNTLRNLFGGEKDSNSENKHTSDNREDIKDLKILVVEDNKINQLVARKIFTVCGFSEPDMVDDGEKAVLSVRNIKYDMVFMDIHMPIMNGFEATRAIRESGNQTYIIAMTANAMDGDKENCLESGMNDYISKPICINNLKVVINKWLKLNDLNIELT